MIWLNFLENQQHYFEDMIKENLPYLVNLLVDKVIVEKVNGDRKHIKLSIYFDFNTPDIDIDLDMNTKNELKSRSLQPLACRRQTPVLKCSCIDAKQFWCYYKNIKNNSITEFFWHFCH